MSQLNIQYSNIEAHRRYTGHADIRNGLIIHVYNV